MTMTTTTDDDMMMKKKKNQWRFPREISGKGRRGTVMTMKRV
jgi:hypothetical protein